LLLMARKDWPKDEAAKKGFISTEIGEALRADPKNAWARALQADGDAALVRTAAAESPADWRGWFALGLARNVDLSEREAAFRKAIAANPESAVALGGLARALIAENRPQEALPF